MRIGIIILLVLSWCLIDTTRAGADEFYQTVAVQHARLYGEKIQLPVSDRDHYVSQGQEYLRKLARREMMAIFSQSWLNSAWFYLDAEQPLAGMEADIGSTSQLNWLPISTKIRVLADENINHYLACGGALPIEVELESTYHMSQTIQVQAKLEAPFDDYLKLRLGSQMQLSPFVHSQFQYDLAANGHGYDGLSMGIGWQLERWQVRLHYRVTADYTEMHHLSIARAF